MEPADLEPQQQALRKNGDVSKGLDYELWHATQLMTSVRQQLAEYQAALGCTQLEYHRLSRERENLQTLYDTKCDALVQSWGEYDRLNESLLEEISKNEQLSELLVQTTHDLQREVSLREAVEPDPVKHLKNLTECQQTVQEQEGVIEKLEEDCMRYVNIFADHKEQLRKKDIVTEEPRDPTKELETETSEPSLSIGFQHAQYDERDKNVNNLSPVTNKRPNKKRKTKC